MKEWVLPKSKLTTLRSCICPPSKLALIILRISFEVEMAVLDANPSHMHPFCLPMSLAVQKLPSTSPPKFHTLSWHSTHLLTLQELALTAQTRAFVPNRVTRPDTASSGYFDRMTKDKFWWSRWSKCVMPFSAPCVRQESVVQAPPNVVFRRGDCIATHTS